MEDRWSPDLYRPHFTLNVGYYFPINHEFHVMKVEYVAIIFSSGLFHEHVIGYYYRYVPPASQASHHKG